MADQQDVLARLSNIENSLALLVRLQLGPVLDRELAEEKMEQLYRLTGKASVIEIKHKLKLGTGTISDAWKRWERLGMVTKTGKQYLPIV
jgi:hypothetical protein